MRGCFVTVEGIEGVGKTTNLNLLSELIKSKGHQLIQTREPGGTDIAEEIRYLLLRDDLPSMHEDTELLLMFAARCEHLRKKIQPALGDGTWVLCDRFTDATYAYQGGGRGVSQERIAVLETWVQDELRPDCCIVLDAPVELALSRAKARSDLDRFEQEDIEFFERVRAVYLARAKADPEHYLVIDASQDLLAVREQITDAFSVWMGA